MSRITLWLSTISLGLAAFAQLQAAPLYQIRDITPSGYFGATAYDVNSDGDAVGVATSASGEAFFFYDHSTGVSTAIGVGTVSPRGSIVGTGFREAAINDSGLIAGTARFLSGVTESRGFIYSGGTVGTFSSLGTFPVTGSRPSSDALDINSSGVATGTATSGAGTIPSEGDNIDIYKGTASPISDIDGDLTVATRFDRGRALNDAGLVAGSNQDGKATLFSGAAETLLLSGNALDTGASVATDLNELGQATGFTVDSNRSFIYETDTSITEIPLLGTGARINALAINESGDVVGKGDRSLSLDGASRGFFYDASAATSFILEDHVVDLSVPAITGLGDWEKLRTAFGVNDDGWIVGVGDRRFTGDAFPTSRAYLLIPVPEPNTAAVCLLLSMAVSMTRRRRLRL